MAQTIALTHHEKWDESGYSKGLKQGGIPQAGRIVCLADKFDVLMSERPGRKAFTQEQAMYIIEKQKGKHFDPKVVDAFFQAKEEILEIIKTHAVGRVDNK